MKYNTCLWSIVLWWETNVDAISKSQNRISTNVSLLDYIPPIRIQIQKAISNLHPTYLYMSNIYILKLRLSYLYLVTNLWRKIAINNLVNSDPAHCLLPPPKGIKFLETAYESNSYISLNINKCKSNE
jgi:hypothetical protein